MSIIKLITNPKLAIIGVVFGPIVGLFYKTWAINFQYINDIYLTLMQLAVIPLMVVTIMIGVLELIYNPNAGSSIKSILAKTAFMFIVVSVISIIVTNIFKPWEDMIQNRDILRVVYISEPIIQEPPIGIDEPIDSSKKTSSLGEFIKSSIPSNIFQSLSTGNIIQVIIFFIIFTVAFGYTTQNTPSSEKAKNTLNHAFEIFQQINEGILQFLPFLSFFIIAYQSLFLSVDTLKALISFVFCFIALYSACIVVYIIMIWRKSKLSLMTTLKGLAPSMIVAFLSRSTLIATSAAMKDMDSQLKFSPNIVRLVMPLGAGLLRFGSLTMYFVAAILTAHLFNVSLGIYEYIALILLGALASFVSVSANNPVAFYQTLSIVLAPLGLPASAVISIFIAVDFILDAFDIIANVLGICALTAICDDKKK